MGLLVSVLLDLDARFRKAVVAFWETNENILKETYTMVMGCD